MTGPSPADQRRRKAYEAGRTAEWLALAALVLRGSGILAHRYSVSGGEIDIVARRGSVVAFVEVKARPTHGEASDAITARKRRRIERAAAVWLSRNGWATTATLRGDAVLVAPRSLPRHIPAAFELRIG